MSYSNGTEHQQGIALLGAMVLVLILSLLGATLLNLAGQEAVSAIAERQAAVAQQLADAAGELVMAWIHSPQVPTAPPAISSLLAKKNRNAEGGPSFFDSTGRSQFVGTASQPGFRLDAGNPSDHQMLNDSEVGLFRAMRHLGTVEELKIYAPSSPGLLCTIDATVATQDNPPVRQSVLMQLGALDLPPLRAAVQVGQNLGVPQPGSESPVNAHWGDIKVAGDLVLGRADEIPAKSALATVTGQGYDETAQREDRWMEAWVGGQIQVIRPPSGQVQQPSLPHNVHQRQNPVPGIRLDQWTYEQLKRVAKRYGSYFAIDQDGLLYPQGVVEPGHGISPDDVFRSKGPGDHRGLIFIDTLDQAAPRTDNLGILKLRGAYLEGIVVVQGHVVLAPSGLGQSISILSPPTTGQNGDVSRMSVQLSRVNLNGVLYASGNITVSGKAKMYGAVAAGGTIASGGSGGTLEVWYDHDLGQGLYRGLPVVYRAPGTWLTRY
ncbi:MAG: pilus assembly PilX N-terminal domain-containing protein [Nitrospirae bacterium]|nr:pilus assembly PilX N-terminal domain-containing protein [Nitrospirota bacterium]